MNDRIDYGKKDGFKNEQLFIIPTESFINHSGHPLIKNLYLTDVGFFPYAKEHFRKREEGIKEYILIYCVEGKGIIELGGKIYKLEKETVFCIPANTPHIYYADKNNPWSIFWVHFKGENTSFFPLTSLNIIKMNSRKAGNRMISLFEHLFRVLERNYTLGNFIYISQVLGLILSEVYYREKVDEISKSNKYVTLIIRYMYKKINKNLTLDDISKEFNLSKSYIITIFKKYTERAPIDFFINIKMQEACKLLKSTEMYTKEIALELGYSDPYYFSRLFKKFVGVSPREYKNSEYSRTTLK